MYFQMGYKDTVLHLLRSKLLAFGIQKIFIYCRKAAWKRLHENCKKFTIKCALLFSCGEGRGEFLLCVSLVGEMGGNKSKMADHACFGCPTSNISAWLQTFQLWKWTLGNFFFNKMIETHTFLMFLYLYF